jgi:hypothetical protein
MSEEHYNPRNKNIFVEASRALAGTAQQAWSPGKNKKLRAHNPLNSGSIFLHSAFIIIDAPKGQS